MGASIGDDLDAVKENHARVYRALDVNGERAKSCWLVHSVDALVITAESRRNGKLQKADAILTDLPDTPLVMRFADCVPLLLYDKARGARLAWVTPAGAGPSMAWPPAWFTRWKQPTAVDQPISKS